MFKYIKDILEKEDIKVYKDRWPNYISLGNADHLLDDEIFCQMVGPGTSPIGEVTIPTRRIEKLFKFILNKYSERFEFMNSIVYYNFGELQNAHHNNGDTFYSFFKLPKNKDMFIKPIETFRNHKVDEFVIGENKIVVFEFEIDVCQPSGMYTFELKPLLIPEQNQTVKINPEQLLTPKNEPVEATVIRVDGLKCFVNYKSITLKLPLEDIIIDNEKEYIEYIKKSFEEGKIVCMTTPGDDLYKLSTINHRVKEYAFISIDGGSGWATGKSTDIEKLVGEYLDDMIIFEDKIEYIKYLKEEFLDEI